MSDKTLKSKAIKFKGRDYVQVADRVKYFNETYPNGCIKTEMITVPESDIVIFRAIATPDITQPDRYYTGYSQAKWSDSVSFVNKTSALENSETSAVGRCLAFMSIGVLDGIASIDEINKTTHTNPELKKEYEQETIIEDFGTPKNCPKCGAPMKYSPTSKRWYCSAICWKK